MKNLQCSTSWLMSYRNRRCLVTHVNPNVRRGLLRVMAPVKNIKNGNCSEKTTTIKSKKITEETDLSMTTLSVVNEPEHKRCLRCGRKLKNPEYRVLGYGPVCYEKLKTPNIKKLF